MCELLGLSASQRIAGPALPLNEFQARGGATADNPDGWGIAWCDGSDICLEREPLPGHSSARFAGAIASLRSDLLIAHVRKARWPPVNTLGNTHPFVHPCCGRHWVFAHNGLVPELVAMELANTTKACRLVGETDSEFGEHLIAYGHDRLHHLESHDDGVDFALVATEPLGDAEGWTPFQAGELRIYRAGLSVGRISTNPRRAGNNPIRQ